MINSVRQKRELPLPVPDPLASVKGILGGILSAVNCLLKDLIAQLKLSTGILGAALDPTNSIILALEELVACVVTAAQKITGASLANCTPTTNIIVALKNVISGVLIPVLGSGNSLKVDVAVETLLSSNGPLGSVLASLGLSLLAIIG